MSKAAPYLPDHTASDARLARYELIRPFLEDGVPLARIAQAEGISVRTAERWVRAYRREGLDGLARKPRSDRNASRYSPRIVEVIEGLALRRPALSAASIYRKVLALADSLGEPAPSYRTVAATIRQIDPALKMMAHHGAKTYADTYDLVRRREAEGPNAVWQADHTELDVWVKDDDGNARKPWLTIVLDDYSRAVAGYFLSFSAPSAIQTALALRQAIWRKPQPDWHVCGIPEVLYTDHGSDFTSRHIEQVAIDLKMRMVFSAVGRPRGRGKIERFFATVSQVFLPRLPGYGPGSVVRKAGLTLFEVAAALEQYLLREYHLTPHSATRESPQARWTAGGFLPRMPASLEQLDLLLLTVPKARRVHPDGVHFLGMRYLSPTLAAYVGEPVIVRYDPRDVAELRLFHRNRFLCKAVCHELAGETVPLRDVVRARDRRRRELRRTLAERRKAVDSLIDARRFTPEPPDAPGPPEPPRHRLKRYRNE